MKQGVRALVVAVFLSSLAATAAPFKNKASAPSLTAEDILAKYLQAIGGARLKQVKTIVKKSERTRGDAQWQYTTYRRAPNLYATFTTRPKGDKTAAGFDGTTLWVLPSKPLEANQEIGFEWFLEQTAIATEFRIRPYRKVRLLGTKNVRDRTAYVVELTQEEAERHTYYLDIQNFLLLRLDAVERYKIGPGPSVRKDIGGSYLSRSTTYYSDWHQVNGVMFPFEIRSTEDSQDHDHHGQTLHRSESVTKVIEYQIDEPIDDAVFTAPPGSVKRTVK